MEDAAVSAGARPRPLTAILVALGGTLAGCALLTHLFPQTFPPLGGEINLFLAYALAGGALIFASVRPTLVDLLLASGLTLLGIHLVGFAALFDEDHPVRSFSRLLAMIGGATIISLAVRTARSRGESRRRLLPLLLATLIIPLFTACSGFFLPLTTTLHPLVRDATAYALDATFGVQASFLLGRWVTKLPALGTLARFAYVALPMAFAFVHALELDGRDRARRGSALVTFLTMGTVGYALYHVYPVVGPIYYFAGRFPDHPAALPAVAPAEALAATRNCMPSLHTAWALILYWHARPLGGWARAFGLGWLVATVVATLAFGFHYLVDVIVALPFAAAVDAASARSHPGAAERARRRVIVTGAALTAAWYLVLLVWHRLFIETRGLTLVLAMATVAATWRVHAAWAARPLPTSHPRTLTLAAQVGGEGA